MKVKFGDVLYIKGRIGWQLLKKHEYLSSGDYYLVTGVDITDTHRINFDQCYFVSKERYEMDDKIQLRVGDIIVTKDGTIGKIGIIDKLDKPATLNSHLFLIRNERTDILDTNYLFQILRSESFQKFASNNTSGSNIPAFTQANITNFEIDLPPLEEQIEVSKTLKDIDEKIINNDKIIAELESMAKTLYDYWFLQFEFPNEEGKPYKSSGGKMVYNEELKREIPEGWILKHAVDIAEIKTGKEDANHSTENGQYPFFTCSNDILKCDDYKFDSNSILIAGNGDFNVKHYKGKFNAYQRTYVITPFNEKYIGLFELCCKQTIERFKKGSNGSIVKFITLGDIQNIQMIDSGHDDLLKPFNDVLVKIDVIKKENQELASLRDFLLPMLMNGQVTFK